MTCSRAFSAFVAAIVARVAAFICWIARLFNWFCIATHAGFITSDSPECCNVAPAALACSAGAIKLPSATTTQDEPGPPGPNSMVSAYT